MGLTLLKLWENENYQTITAEGKASLKKMGMLYRASFEKPDQALEHEGENFTYNDSIKTFIQYDIELAKAAPLLPSPDLNTIM